MAIHNDLGKRGEDLAAKMLKDKGYRILERNWRFRDLEVDIIAQKDKNDIVVVEVKTRSDDSWMYPEQSVDKKRQIRLSVAAKAYVNYHRMDVGVRFDIVAIVWNNTRCDVEHIEDAFRPPMRVYGRNGKYYI